MGLQELLEVWDHLPATDWRLWDDPRPDVDPREVVRTDRIRRRSAGPRY